MYGNARVIDVGRSVEETLIIKEKKLDNVKVNAIQALMPLWPVLTWLFLYNILIWAAPILVGYLYLFFRFYRKYRRLKDEIGQLRSLQLEEAIHNRYIEQNVLYFRR